MPSIIRATSNNARNFLFPRAMTTLAPGHILRGTRCDYRIIESIKGDATHSSTLFKASVLSKNEFTRAPIWAVIKTALPSDRDAQENLKCEYDTYRLPEVTQIPHFREIYDVIGDPQNFDDTTEAILYLTLEWMDFSLADLSYDSVRNSYSTLKAVIDAVLFSYVALAARDRVNTDTKPANILLSNIYGDNPIVKVADLGSVYPDGTRVLCQPLAMRAPEVYEGRSCTHCSQIWAFAATLLCWMKPGVLGSFGEPNPLLREPWCIAKIRRLFPEWLPSPTKDPIRQTEFECSTEFIEDLPSNLAKTLSLEEEMQTIPMLPELRDLLRCLFVIDPEKRPSAAKVLRSKEYLALAEKARVGLK